MWCRFCKIQTFITEDIITKKAKKADYQIDKKRGNPI